MMDIRAITLGIDWEKESKNNTEKIIGSFHRTARRFYEKNSVTIRTNRLLLNPVNSWHKIDPSGANVIIKWLSELCKQNNIRWFCLPFSVYDEEETSYIYDIALECSRRYKNSFLNFIVAKNGKIKTKALLDTAKFIQSVSRLSNNGYDNFRNGVSCNCEAHGPFFPFTYHEGENGFSIALELPKVFIKIIEKNREKSLELIRKQLIDDLVSPIKEIECIAIEIEKSTSMKYYGIDLSLAPFPEDNNSVAQIIELLGVEKFGSHGTLFFISFLTDMLKKLINISGIKSVGFNGVMLSLLEDKNLNINNEKIFTIDSLLSFSAVCGCGIDMVPIPGDTFQEEIASLIMDVAALSIALKKPLGVRILPIPAKHENEFTDFNYDFLYNSRIMGMRNRISDIKLFRDEKIFEYLHYRW